jgi:hypothetical protein
VDICKVPPFFSKISIVESLTYRKPFKFFFKEIMNGLKNQKPKILNNCIQNIDACGQFHSQFSYIIAISRGFLCVGSMNLSLALSLSIRCGERRAALTPTNPLNCMSLGVRNTIRVIQKL